MTWPLLLIRVTFGGLAEQEKAFIVFSFLIFLVLAYVIAEFSVRLAERSRGSRLSTFSREGLKFLVVLFVATNFFTINANADGGTVSDSLVLELAVLSCVLALTFNLGRRGVYSAAAFSSFGILLDPVYYPEFAVLLVLTFVIGGLLHFRLRRSLANLALCFALQLPALVFILLAIHSTAVPSGPFYNYRAFDPSAIQAGSVNSGPLQSLSLLGYYWSTVTFAPPSILAAGASISALPSFGSPTQILLPQSPLTTVWLLSIFAGPMVAWSALLSYRSRQTVLPVALAGLVGIALSVLGLDSGGVSAVADLTRIPLVGGEIGTAFALPEHFLLLVAASYVVLLPVGLLNVASAIERGLRLLRGAFVHRRVLQPLRPATNENLLYSHRRTIRFTAAIVPTLTMLMICLVLFAGWQGLNGSYYPSRASGTYVSGNGVPDSAPFTPVHFQPDIVEAYSIIRDQPGAFNIYWPSGGADTSGLMKNQYLFHGSDAPKPLSPLPSLPFLVSHNLTVDLVQYLAANNVRFLVVQDSFPSALMREYGLPDYAAIRNVVNAAPGLNQFFSGPDLTIYDLPGALGSVYPAKLISAGAPATEAASTSYALFKSLGQNVALSLDNSSAPTFGIDGYPASLEAYTPGFIGLSGLRNYANASVSNIPIHQTFPMGNVTNLGTGGPPINTTQNNGQLSLGNWTNTNWGTKPLQVTFQGGDLRWDSSSFLSAVSLSYNGTLSGAPGGVRVLNPEVGPIQVTTTFKYRTSASFSGNLSVYTYGDDSKLSPTGFSNLPLTPSIPWHVVSASTLLPTSTAYFDVRVQVSEFAGQAEFQNVSISWGNRSLNLTTTQVGDSIDIYGWTSTNWGGIPLNTTYGGGTLTWSSRAAPPVVSLSYNGTLASGDGGVFVSNSLSQVPVAVLDFGYRTSPDFTGQLQAYTLEVNRSFQQLPGSVRNLAPSPQWATVRINLPLPEGTTYFTPRLQALNLTGSVQFKDVNLSWVYVAANSSLPFGGSYDLAGERVGLNLPSKIYMVLWKGSGTLNGQPVNSIRGQTYSWSTAVAPTGLVLAGNLSVASLLNPPDANLTSFLPTVVVFAQPYYPDLTLTWEGRTYPSRQSIDDTAFFVVPSPAATNGSIQYTSIHTLELTYPAIVAWSGFLLYLAISPSTKDSALRSQLENSKLGMWWSRTIRRR
ncbi:MAG: hypothetical protein L3K14_00210 [Thermoplasmata archaeon]|nr:hypothetical protein [Thermoplasmata archaeon]